MIFISEWLPNPNGADTKTEFIELFNSGNTSVSLNGWSLKATGKKVFSLGGRTIAAHGYLVLSRTETKLSLKNTGETISLYDANGRLADQSSYLGAAPSGESFSRVNYPSDLAVNAASPQSFAWGTPTPGAANKVNLHNGISANDYPFGVALNAAPSGAQFFLMLLGVAAFLAALVVYFLKSDENLSKLFFSRDGGVR